MMFTAKGVLHLGRGRDFLATDYDGVAMYFCISPYPFAIFTSHFKTAYRIGVAECKAFANMIEGDFDGLAFDFV